MIPNPKGVPGYLYKQMTIRKKWEEIKEYREKLGGNKIITIFAHYNSKSDICRSDMMYINDLLSFSNVVFVSNSEVPIEMQKKCGIDQSMFMQRENIGFDFGAWKDAIKKYEKVIEEYDYLILANNSVYAPVYDIKGVVGYMTQRKGIDFWGITAFTESHLIKSPESKNFGKNPLPQHIQSYFLLFSSKMIDTYFLDFWDKMDYPQSFNKAVEDGELRLTSYFEKEGYKWDVLVEETKKGKIYFDGPDLTKNRPELLLYYGSPFIKKKALERITNRQVNEIYDILMNVNKELLEIIRDDNEIKVPSKTYIVLNKIFRKGIKKGKR